MTEVINKTAEAEQIEESLNAYVEIGKAILKLLLKVARFGLYLAIMFVEMFTKLLKALFLSDYEPFKAIIDSKNRALDKRAETKIDKYKVKFVSDTLSRHEYNFQRSEQFLAQYKYLQEKLQEISDNNIIIDREIYRDIFKRISILVVEAENKALKEGYDYAKETKYKLSEDEIYNEYVRDKILRGESNTDWGELKE